MIYFKDSSQVYSTFCFLVIRDHAWILSKFTVPFVFGY